MSIMHNRSRALTIVGVAAVALATLSGCAAPATTVSKPHASASSSPSKTADAPEAAPTPSFDFAAGLSVAKYPTPEALSQAEAEMQTAWYNDGANKQNLKSLFSMKVNLSSADYAAKVAAETDTQYESSVLVSNWQSKTELSAFVNRIVNNHKNTVNLYFITSNYDGSVPEDKEPYRRTVNVIKLVSATKQLDGTWTIITQQNESDNSDKNRSNKLTGGKVLGEQGTAADRVSTTWVQLGGKWLISDIINLDE